MALTIAATTTDPTNPMDAGHTTTEWGGTKVVMWLSGIIAVLGSILTVVQGVSQVLPANFGQIGMYLMIAGAVVAGLKQVAYEINRTLLKVKAIQYGEDPPPDPTPVAAPPVTPAAAAANLAGR